MTPNAGTGTSAAFDLTYTSTAGASDLTQLFLLVHTTTANATNACCVGYRSDDTIVLMNDAGTSGTIVARTSPGSIQNSQCTVLLDGATTVTTNGPNTLVVHLVVSFHGSEARRSSPSIKGGRGPWAPPDDKLVKDWSIMEDTCGHGYRIRSQDSLWRTARARIQG